jgi:2-phospho-L-lactate guanylyltransferase
VIRFILPVKGFERGKSRLELPASRRAELTEAMFVDTVQAVLAAELGPAVVVSEDERSLTVAREQGARTFRHAGGLNAAIEAAGDTGLCAAILPDLPALRPEQLQEALRGVTNGFVADWSGVGTTMLVGRNLHPHFGPNSAQRHKLVGYPQLPVPACGLRADVDTLEDLERARALGLGPRTVAALVRMADSNRLGRVATSMPHRSRRISETCGD